MFEHLLQIEAVNLIEAPPRLHDRAHSIQLHVVHSHAEVLLDPFINRLLGAVDDVLELLMDVFGGPLVEPHEVHIVLVEDRFLIVLEVVGELLFLFFRSSGRVIEMLVVVLLLEGLRELVGLHQLAELLLGLELCV